MTTRTQKIGTLNQKYKNGVHSQLALLKRQNKNAQKKRFQESTKEQYFSKREFVRTWKGRFPIKVINAKWAKMDGKVSRKSKNPFRELIKDLSW